MYLIKSLANRKLKGKIKSNRFYFYMNQIYEESFQTYRKNLLNCVISF